MRVGDWIWTYTGRAFYPLDPRPEEIDIKDIAHALSLTCRFTGHVRTFYSVAQHSLLVSYVCPDADALWGLLHDAAEAYICDVSRPVKHAPAMQPYRNIEEGLQLMIYAAFGLTGPEPPSVKQADRMLLHTERRDLMTPCGTRWETDLDPSECAPWTITPLTPEMAEAAFVKRFKRLTADRAWHQLQTDAVAGMNTATVAERLTQIEESTARLERLARGGKKGVA